MKKCTKWFEADTKRSGAMSEQNFQKTKEISIKILNFKKSVIFPEGNRV